ncbi:uncharacterized protein EI90DRAFT_3153008 [Cantharellus anzutake]|uniref:uncharacterized protein n=1 Tax=Cantharellus anzutake TaxID=1750568 RepID=UPI00190517DE|nr:uncharacterized protein EI90DRAFT_3153008 [Cantharellus anzutake]KAF8335400.1 hypothetical protein EI90DRAFT_3153008 [Cantharellus anzutake]
MDSAQSSPSNVERKKQRRQTAVYPNINSTNKVEKPFSKSAAKRDSVLALGSIEHLQHYFTKTGLSASKKPLSGKGPFVPALGPLAIPQDQPSVPTLIFDLPPSPELPKSTVSHAPPSVDPTPFIDVDALKATAIQDLEDVQTCWSLSPTGSSALGLQTMKLLDPFSPSVPSNHLNILDLLKVTTRAIRSVRNYMLALPEDDPSLKFRPHVVDAFRNQPHQKVKYASLRVVSPKKSTKSLHHITTQAPPPQVLTVPLPPSTLTLIRKSALDVLGALRDIEERCRLPMSDDPFEMTGSGVGNRRISQSPTPFLTERTASPSTHSADDDVSELGGGTAVSSSTSWSSPRGGRRATKSPSRPDVVPLIVQGRNKAVHVWADPSDDEWEDDIDEDSKRDPWDERLVLGGGWLYRNDVDLASLGKEKEIVNQYLDVVDEILFGGASGVPGHRGWVRAKIEMASGSKLNKRTGRPSFGGVGGSPRKTDEKRLVSHRLLHAMNDLASVKETEDTDDAAIEEEEEEEEEIPDNELPDWAKRSKFHHEPLSRLLSFLISYLPPDLLPFLPFPPTPPSSPPASPSSAQRKFRSKLLDVLSDGQIICTAYNGAVRKSKRPWGFIQLETVHDLLELTEDSDVEEEKDPMSLGSGMQTKGKTTWTFRRTENLRFWAAAVGLRYMIPFTDSPLAEDGSAKRLKLPRTFIDPILSPPIFFDPRVPARREEGWEDMLERALFRWLDAVLLETRSP